MQEIRNRLSGWTPALSILPLALLCLTASLIGPARSQGGGMITLPDTQTASSSSCLFNLTNTGLGGALCGTGGSGAGVTGASYNGYGVSGMSNLGYAGYFVSGNSSAMVGISNGASSTGVLGVGATGVYGQSSGSGEGVLGTSTNGSGLYGTSANGYGVYGQSTASHGVYGTSIGTSGDGVRGISTGFSGAGVYGEDDTHEKAGNGTGVLGTSAYGAGVNGISTYGSGVYGFSSNSYGVLGTTNNTDSYAGYFIGNLKVTGAITAGTKDFKIDHPLDPANKYLLHACVESNEMKTVYDGTILTDSSGDATITLPDWFEALNKEFRYQLTVVGQFAQAIIATKIQDNRFTIKTDKPNIEVCWQVTGVRQDAYAKAHPLEVEQEKPEKERGKYLHPVENGMPESLGLDYEMLQRMKRSVHTPEQKAHASTRQIASLHPAGRSAAYGTTTKP